MEDLESPDSIESYAKPDLDPETWERIDTRKYKVHRTYWNQLSAFVVLAAPISLLGGPKEPPPPKQPIALGRLLGQYACELFDIEVGYYPDDPRLNDWLAALAMRTEKLVMQNLKAMPRPFTTFEYHATKDQMLSAVRAALDLHLQRRALSGTSSDPATTPLTEVGKYLDQLRLGIAASVAGLAPPPRQAPTLVKVHTALRSLNADSVCAQLRNLKDERHLTNEQLADETGLSARSVQRHMAGKMPYGRNLNAYERAFTKLLGRKVVIRNMS